MFTKGSEFEAFVERCIDGDTFKVRTHGMSIIVRLGGMDAPENGQPFYINAYNELRRLIEKKVVNLRVEGNDRYGRLICYATYENGDDITSEMLVRGLAFYYSPKRKINAYLEAEKAAKRNKVGVHALKNYEKPWEYRKHRPNL